MPKGKPKMKFGKQSLVDDELDAWDYAEEDSHYQRWEEKQVKENKEVAPESKEKPPVKEKPTEKPAEKPTEKPVEEPAEKPVEEPVEEPQEEIVLEQFDDWEAAMDALDAKISQEEAKKAAARNLK